MWDDKEEGQSTYPSRFVGEVDVGDVLREKIFEEKDRGGRRAVLLCDGREGDLRGRSRG